MSSNFGYIGLTDNVSVGAGFEFLSLTFGNPIWYFAPKVGFKVAEKLHASAGVLMGGYEAEGSVGLASGVITYGGQETNVSLSGGYGFSYYDGDFSNNPVHLLSISGMHRVNKTIAIVSENYLLNSESITNKEVNLVGIEGVRLLAKKNAFDVGLIVPFTGDMKHPLPWVGYVRNF